MKIRLFAAFLALLLLCLSTGCGTPASQVQALYQQFMDGNLLAVDKDGEAKPLSAYFEWVWADREEYSYTYIDMTGDGVEELCIHQSPSMCFFTVKDGELYFWHGEYTLYTRLLNNGAFLWERHGGAPTHIRYEYKELDADAKVKHSVTFAWYDGATVEPEKTYPDTYLFDEQEVSKEEYEERTKTYLSIGSDNLIWTEHPVG